MFLSLSIMANSKQRRFEESMGKASEFCPTIATKAEYPVYKQKMEKIMKDLNWLGIADGTETRNAFNREAQLEWDTRSLQLKAYLTTTVPKELRSKIDQVAPGGYEYWQAIRKEFETPSLATKSEEGMPANKISLLRTLSSLKQLDQEGIDAFVERLTSIVITLSRDFNSPVSNEHQVVCFLSGLKGERATVVEEIVSEEGDVAFPRVVQLVKELHPEKDTSYTGTTTAVSGHNSIAMGAPNSSLISGGTNSSLYTSDSKVSMSDNETGQSPGLQPTESTSMSGSKRTDDYVMVPPVVNMPFVTDATTYAPDKQIIELTGGKEYQSMTTVGEPLPVYHDSSWERDTKDGHNNRMSTRSTSRVNGSPPSTSNRLTSAVPTGAVAMLGSPAEEVMTGVKKAVGPTAGVYEVHALPSITGSHSQQQQSRAASTGITTMSNTAAESGTAERRSVQYAAYEETTLHRGLTNQVGENNCFLNVTIQALWHLGPFRAHLKSFIGTYHNHHQQQEMEGFGHALYIKEGVSSESTARSSVGQDARAGQPKPLSIDSGPLSRPFTALSAAITGAAVSADVEPSGMLDSLCNLFIQYEFTDATVLPPTQLRLALSALSSQFELGKIADANEALDAILQRVHSECSSVCPDRRKCLSHLVFGGLVMEQATCSACGGTGEPLLRSDFIMCVHAAELLADANKLLVHHTRVVAEAAEAKDRLQDGGSKATSKGVASSAAVVKDGLQQQADDRRGGRFGKLLGFTRRTAHLDDYKSHAPPAGAASSSSSSSSAAAAAVLAERKAPPSYRQSLEPIVLSDYFGVLLKKCMTDNQRSCPSLDLDPPPQFRQPDGSMKPLPDHLRCTGRANVARYCLEAPLAIALSVGWTQTRESAQVLQQFLSMISLSISLNDLFIVDAASTPKAPSALTGASGGGIGPRGAGRSFTASATLNADAKLPVELTASRGGGGGTMGSSRDIGTDSGSGSSSSEMSALHSTISMRGKQRRGPSYVFRGLVCYYGLHYVSIFQQFSNAATTSSTASSSAGPALQQSELEVVEQQYLLFDDQNIRVIGDWAAVQELCVKALYQPVLLLYELERTV